MEEEDAALCSDVETFPELLQLRVNQVIELCTTDPEKFAKPRGGVSSEEQYRAYAQSIVRELRRNIDAAEQVLNRAQAHLPEILSKVHPVSLPLPLFRIWRDWTAEQPEDTPAEELKEKKDCAEYRLYSSLGGERLKRPIFQVKTEGETVKLQLSTPYYIYADLCKAANSLLETRKSCPERDSCPLAECFSWNIEALTVHIRDGTGRTQKKPDEEPGCTKIRLTADSNLTPQR